MPSAIDSCGTTRKFSPHLTLTPGASMRHRLSSSRRIPRQRWRPTAAFLLGLACMAGEAAAQGTSNQDAARAQRRRALAAVGSVRIAEIPWTDAVAHLDTSAIVVIPIGAEAKEHGPQLPLNNDWLLAEYFAQRVASATRVVLYPTVNYHFYPAFVEYPGSTTLRLATARDVVVDIVRTIAAHGPRRFYILNTGVSTLRALAPARDSLAASGLVMRYTDILSIGREAEEKVRQQAGGTHADEMETSMMLYMHPEVVQMAKAADDYHPGSGGLTRDSLKAVREGKTWSRTGIYGNATLATREKGRVVVEAQVKGMIAEVEALRRLPIR